MTPEDLTKQYFYFHTHSSSCFNGAIRAYILTELFLCVREADCSSLRYHNHHQTQPYLSVSPTAQQAKNTEHEIKNDFF